MLKTFSGSWFEFQHHNPPEGKYWNPVCRAFSEEQWREKVREMKSLDMKYIVLLCTSLVYEDYARRISRPTFTRSPRTSAAPTPSPP